MDLVRLSAASGFALMAALVLAASGSDGRVEALAAEPTTTLSPDHVRDRIDDAFRAPETPVFDVTGLLFSAQGGAHPTLPPHAAPPRWPLAGASVDAWSAYIDEASQRFGVPADWVRGVMQQESGGRTHLGGRPITSSAGALGLMQVMPGTFAEMSALHGLGRDPHDPRANILVGTAYLRAMYDRYGPAHFLAAYNAGPGRVDEHLRTGRALPGETRAYTAALQTRLVPGAAPNAVGMQHVVQDLTSPEAIRVLASPASRPQSRRAVDPATASVFADTSAPEAAPVQQRDVQPIDSLFVTLKAADRRRETPAANPRED